MSHDARALWITAPGSVELRHEQLAPPGQGEVLIETLFSGISRGTESLVFCGRVPESEWQRMRAPFQAGEFPGPVKYGYANVGVVRGGNGIPPGTRVFSLYPHQSQFVIAADRVHALPPSVPSARAVLAANMETALNAIWDAAPLPGDRITVVGAGVLGCLVLSLLTRYPAIDVEVIEPATQRASLIEALGGRLVTPDSASAERDCVVHTSATAAGLQTALGLCKFQGKVLELSWYGARETPVTLGAAFHSQRLSLLSSQVGGVSPNKPGWSFGDRLALALRLLDDPRLDGLLGAPIAFESLPTRYAEVLSTASAWAAPGIVVQY